MSTSFDTVRNEQIVAIRALTPTSLAGSPFVASLGEHDFRTWAQATGKDSLRRFDIEDAFSDSVPEVHGWDVMYRPHLCDVLVAYPHDYRYGAQNRRSLDRVIREDLAVIDYAIGAWGTGNYTDACAQLQSVTIETYEAVSVLVIRYMLHFTEATSGQAVSAVQNDNHQTFRVTTSTSSDQLAVTIPLAMKDATYIAQAQVIDTTYGGVRAMALDAGKTATGFTLQFSATLPSGVTVDVEVEDR